MEANLQAASPPSAPDPACESEETEREYNAHSSAGLHASQGAGWERVDFSMGREGGTDSRKEGHTPPSGLCGATETHWQVLKTGVRTRPSRSGGLTVGMAGFWGGPGGLRLSSSPPLGAWTLLTGPSSFLAWI